MQDNTRRSDYVKYRRASNRVNAEVRKAVRDFEKSIASEAKPKAFYKYVRSKISTRIRVSDLKRPDGTTGATHVEKAEVLNNSFFTSVLTVEENQPTERSCMYN